MKLLIVSFLLLSSTFMAGAADTDGDGVDDAVDNCRTLFNPSQSDYDGNGIGDTCRFVPVDDQYFIGSTEVTNQEYVSFLNAVAAIDPNGVFNTLMNSDIRGGIGRSGSSGSYTYSVRTNKGNKPVNFVSWLDAARYVNWLHNGRPTGAQGSATTESGSYNLTVANPGTSATRMSGAKWFLPTDVEWVRAAYHDVQGGVDWIYPTRSNDTPIVATANGSGDITNPGFNVVNYSSAGNSLTTVGSAGPLSSSAYGTLDQAGNVREWTETSTGSNRRTRGGGFSDAAGPLRADTPLDTSYFTEGNNLGFRVARSISCPDSDGDGEGDCVDNCPSVANPSQSDCNGDGIGDACTICPCDTPPLDADSDGVCNTIDNCPASYNPGQVDSDGDGPGDACDDCPLPFAPDQPDRDHDGIADVCDLDDGLTVIVFQDRDHIHWQQESGWESWNVYTGDLGILKATGVYTQVPGSNPSAKRWCAIGAASVYDSDRPASGAVTFSLVAGVHNRLEGSLGQDSAGAERPNTNPCP